MSLVCNLQNYLPTNKLAIVVKDKKLVDVLNLNYLQLTIHAFAGSYT
jgi:hypothetical protein